MDQLLVAVKKVFLEIWDERRKDAFLGHFYGSMSWDTCSSENV